MPKSNNKGEIRTCPKIVVQPAVTSEKGVVNPVRSGSGSDDESVADNFFLKNHQNRPTVIKLTSSRENKSLL